jgi:phage terminase small subunit
MRQTVTPLDPREERFIALYVENPNGTQAAIAAGYPPKGAHVTASRLLKRAKIKDAIARRNAELLLELDFPPQRIVREIAKVAGMNSADFITIDEETGHPHIDFRGLKRRQLAAVASVENTEKGVKYKTHDKLKALDMLARMARLYPAERTELTGADGGPLTAVTLNASQHKIDIEGMTLEEREQFKQMLLMLKAKRDREERATPA